MKLSTPTPNASLFHVEIVDVLPFMGGRKGRGQEGERQGAKEEISNSGEKGEDREWGRRKRCRGALQGVRTEGDVDSGGLTGTAGASKIDYPDLPRTGPGPSLARVNSLPGLSRSAGSQAHPVRRRMTTRLAALGKRTGPGPSQHAVDRLPGLPRSAGSQAQPGLTTLLVQLFCLPRSAGAQVLLTGLSR